MPEVVQDAVNDLSVPYHLTTKEFGQELKGVLKPEGYYVALVIGKLQGGKVTYAEYVPEVTNHPNYDAAIDALKAAAK